MIVRLLQQFASSGLILLFGVLALRVWRRFGTMRRDRVALAWAVTAASFLVVGLYATAHAVISVIAVAGGEKSWLFGFVSHWAVAGNAGRCLASVLFGVLLVAVMVVPRRTAPRIAAAAPVLLGAAAVAGTLAARWLPTTAYDTFTMMAVLNAATAVVLMAALLAAVQNDGMDQLLWLALAAYALKETVSVSLLAVMTWWDVADVATYYNILLWMQVGVGCGMAALAVRRLHLASGGRRVPAIFERLHALRRPAHGRTGPV